MSATELADILPPGLTPEEANFVYNVEVLMLPARKAASMAGMPFSRAIKPHIVQARDVVKRELRGNMGFTREDIVAGYQEAIGTARLMADPSLGGLVGFIDPQSVDWDFDVDGAQTACATVVFAVRHATAAGALI